MTPRRALGRMWVRLPVRSSHGFVVVSVVTAVVVLFVAVAFGVGNRDAVLHFLGNGAWLADHKSSSVVHVNGGSGRADFRIPVASGDNLEVVQREDGAYVFNPDTCQWTKIDEAKQQLGSPSNASSHAPTDCNRGLVFGDGQAYFVNGQLGSVQEVDPVTLASKGPTVFLNSKMSDSQGGVAAVVDHSGQVDAAVSPLGALAVVAKGRAQARIPFGAAGDATEIVRTQNHVLALDIATRAAALVEPRGSLGARVVLPEVKATGLLVKAEVDDSDLVWGVDSATTRLVEVDTANSASHSVTIHVASGQLTQPGAPVANAGLVYVPDFATGTLFIINPATGQQAKPAVTVGQSGSKSFGVFVKDGHVYANDPNSSQAVVIDSNGDVTYVAKSDPTVPTPKVPPILPPVTTPPVSVPLPPITLPGPGSLTGPTIGVTVPKRSTTTVSTTVPPPVAAAPGAPTGLAATGGKSQISVAWIAPPANGSAVTSYAINWTGSMGDNGSVPPVAAGPITQGASGSYTIPNLKNGEAYTVTVAATNAVGTGPSATSSPATPTNSVPDPPASVNAIADTSGKVTVSWPAPPPSGYPIQTYDISANGQKLAPSLFSGIDLVGTKTFTLSARQLGVSLGTNVDFSVATVTQVNGSQVSGQNSPPSQMVQLVTPPDSPTGVVEGALTSATQAPVSWTAPKSDGGLPVTYQVTANGSIVTPSGLTAVIPLGSSPVAVKVVASNPAGSSAAASLTINPPVPPSFSFGGTSERWPLGGAATLTISVTVNSAYPLSSCTVTLTNVGTTGCSAGSQSVQIGVPMCGCGQSIQGSAQNSLGQPTNATLGSAGLWGVTQTSLLTFLTLPVNFRTGPSHTYGIASSGHRPPTNVPAVCQTTGSLEYLVPGNPNSASSSQWDKMSDGTWVADVYVNPVSLPGC